MGRTEELVTEKVVALLLKRALPKETANEQKASVATGLLLSLKNVKRRKRPEVLDLAVQVMLQRWQPTIACLLAFNRLCATESGMNCWVDGKGLSLDLLSASMLYTWHTSASSLERTVTVVEELA